MTAKPHGRLRRGFRKLRRALAWSLLTLVVLTAVCVGLVSQFLPVLENQPEVLSRWLSNQVGMPISVVKVEARWNRSGPLLALSGLRIGEANDVLDIDHAQLQVNVYSGLWPGLPLTELRIRGPELELHREQNGRWRLDGFGRAPRRSSTQSASQFDMLERFGLIEVTQARFRFSDAVNKREFSVSRIDARMQKRDGHLNFGVHFYGEHPKALLRVAGAIETHMRSGSLYLEGQNQDWAQWSQGLELQGVRITQGQGDLRLWLDIAEGELSLAQVDATIFDIAIQSEITPATKKEAAIWESASFRSWSMQARMQREDGTGWRWMVPSLSVQFDEATTPLRVVDQAHVTRDTLGIWRVQADEIQVSPFLQLARLLPNLSDSARGWLAGAAPQGALRDLRLIWDDVTHYQLHAQLAGIGWQPQEGIPALGGISGDLDADGQAIRFQVEAGDWLMAAPNMLRAPFTPRVKGEILAFNTEDGWRVDTPGLRLYEEHYDILLGGGVLFSPVEGVVLDLRADVASAPIVVAKRFWPINVMPSAAVKWLDAALVDGRVARGLTLVRGPIRHWPFKNAEGRFEAYAELENAHLNYLNAWPLGQSVNGVVTFINRAMDVDLSAEVAGVNVLKATGGISDFGDAILELDVQAEGTGPQLLDVLRKSPLNDAYGAYLSHLEVGGRGTVSLGLHIPMEDHLGKPRVDGHIDIDRMDLSDGSLGLDFTSASGRLRFSERGFSADELNVGFGDSIGALTVAVGDYTSRSEHLVEASLRGRFPVRQLIEKHEPTQWLLPWMSGVSDWAVTLNVPRAEHGEASQPKLRVRSDLVGIEIGLPAPLRKAASDRMPLEMSLGLPVGSSDLSLRLGGLLRLQGGIEKHTGFRGVALFGDAADVSMPARGLHVAGQIPVLDAAAWAAVSRGEGESNSLHVASVDLFAGELNLLGRPFRETRVKMTQSVDHMALQFEGEPLAGKMSIPLESLMLKGITGRFERLYWPEVEALESASQNEGEVFWPSSIPPLHFEIADARFSGASLGTLWLETHPTSNGMHVERLDTHSLGVDIKAKGAWTRVGDKERSSIGLDFSSRNTGAMLESLGFSRLIESESTHGQLQLAWEGAPGAFDWDKTQGQLQLNVGQGRVLEVEPGAGRLFGLLSVAEIPRRLALDFSDFFKSGFAFNEIKADFRIERGGALSDEFRIDAPSAEILLTGRTGLKQRDYDLVMDVQPKAGSMLPALGAIAGGPAGAAVGAVAQAVFKQPLKEMTRSVYRVSGPWSDAKIDVLDRESKDVPSESVDEMSKDLSPPDAKPSSGKGAEDELKYETGDADALPLPNAIEEIVVPPKDVKESGAHLH